jgi:hypothetical protein
MWRSACCRLSDSSHFLRPALQKGSAAHQYHFHPSSRPVYRSLTQAQHRRHQYAFKAPASKEQRLESSYGSYILIVAVLGSCAIFYNFFGRCDRIAPSQARDTPSEAPTSSNDPFFTDMPIAPGHRGNLTAEQELKLRELWALALKTFGVNDPNYPNGTATPHEDTPAASETEGKDDKKKRRSIFGRKHDKSSPSKSVDDSDDKYGQAKEFQQIVSTQSPESLRASFWSMVKADHPDALLLRFLRARKWDVDKALVMMISTMSWRGHEMHVDDDVVFHGELGALTDSKSADANAKREGHDFLEQMRLGKSFLHGTDKEGRPLCFVRARLHHGGDQTERSMERYTVYVIETARLILRPPVETAVSISATLITRLTAYRPFFSICHISQWPTWTTLPSNS